MVTDKIKELEETKAKVVALEASIAEQLNKELAELPAKYGFATVEAFIKAVKALAGGKAAKPRKAKVAKAPGAENKVRRPRAVITDETRAKVKELVEAGKTGAEIAAEVGVSLPSVQNIKKALGLVKAE